MSSDIQFGDLEEAEPQRDLRPDQDAHFATTMVGEIGDDELLIFVDLDVQRDMEAHALSNTRVELGGVMLGRQSIDDEGRPFVVISDSLRAEHYEATKGSFKFTHETWSQITRQRDEFRPDLEMVGWYHTHPGWSVFLSGMDLFICNNFFNRPLDVALVIDPCEQDRGWFQWTEESNPKTQRTGGFVLTTGRFRQLELDQFARIYNKDPLMNMDPRYSGSAVSGAQPSVTVMENRKPVFELAVVGMLMMQFLLFTVVAWEILTPSPLVDDKKDKATITKLESAIKQLTARREQSLREEALNDVLSTLVHAQTGDPNLVDKFMAMQTDRSMMVANLEGQMALADKLKFERNSVVAELDANAKTSAQLKSQLVTTRDSLAQATKRNQELEEGKLGEAGDEESDEEGSKSVLGGSGKWIWLGLSGLAVALMGAALGFVVGKREETFESTATPSSGEFSPGNVEEAVSRDSAFTPPPEPTNDPLGSVPMSIDGAPDDASKN
ncbi:MAG: proteasome lid subunit RPN8/RPN11 [Mariniblastus sp.]